MSDWIKNHGAAVIAFAGALGAFLHATVPAVAAATAPEAGAVAAAIGLAAAVLHAYVQGARPS